MQIKNRSSAREVARLVRNCLRDGSPVQIDGLGVFRRNPKGEYDFEPQKRPQVFLAYATENRAEVKQLSRALRKAGLETWMDCEKLLPGQNWPRAIERAIEASQYFIACLSRKSVGTSTPGRREESGKSWRR